MIILAVDSSAVTAGCAVVEDDGSILAERLINSGLTHSQTLLPVVDGTLKESGKTIKDIGLLAVSAGPGSFTGVRIGIATIKGIAFTANIPCIGVSTLDNIAYSADMTNGYIAAVMDARRNQVYNAVYKVGHGRLDRLTEDRAISVDDLGAELERMDDVVWLCGDGAEMCYKKLNGRISGLKLVPEGRRFQSGRGAAYAAIAAGLENSICADKLLPSYLRLPQAERELNNKICGKSSEV